MALSEDGTLLAVGHADGLVVLFQLQMSAVGEEEETAELLEVGTLALPMEGEECEASQHCVNQ